MGSLLKKPIFRIVFLLLIVVVIPLLIYKFKPQILSGIPYLSNRAKNQQASKPGTCLILEEKYCLQVGITDWTDQQGNTYKLAGFHLPAGVSIFAPIDGEFALPTGGTAPHAGSYGNVRNLNDPTPTGYIFAGDYQPDGFSDNVKTRPVKRGSLIGHTTNTGIDNFGYSLIVRVTKASPTPGKFYTPEDILKQIFPKL